jgi:hypothetical protein
MSKFIRYKKFRKIESDDQNSKNQNQKFFNIQINKVRINLL